MLEKIKKNKLFVITMVALLVLCTLTQSHIPGVYSMPENVEETVNVSEEPTILDALEERMTEIENPDIYMEVGKHVYDVIEEDEIKAELQSENSESEKTDTNTEKQEISLSGYPWSELDDNELTEWICSGKHDDYLKRIIENETDETEKEALDARIYEIVGSENYMTVSDYLYVLENPEKADEIQNKSNPAKDSSTQNIVNEKKTENQQEKIGKKTESAMNGAENAAKGTESVAQVTENATKETESATQVTEKTAKGAESATQNNNSEDNPAVNEEKADNNPEGEKSGDKSEVSETDVKENPVTENAANTGENSESEKTEKLDNNEITEPVVFPWDGMTDEEFAAWILNGENDEYITEIVEAAEKAENQSETVDENEKSEPKSASEKEAATKSAEVDSLNSRVENMEDKSLWENVKDYIHNLVFGEYTKISLKDDDTGVSVEGKLPDNTKLEVIEVDEKQVADFIEKGQKLTFAYDISLVVDGKEYQPEKPVDVTISSNSDKNSEIKVQHIVIDKNTGETVSTKVKNKIDEEGNVRFEAEGFSIYLGTEPILEEELSDTGLINDGMLSMTPGAGYAFYSDEACTEKIDTTGNYPIINGNSEQSVYVKAIEGTGYTISEITCKNTDDSTADCGDVSGPSEDGVWEIAFGKDGAKNQEITVSTLRSGNIDLYVDKGNISFTNDRYIGKNSLGEEISDVHKPEDNYTIHQTVGSPMTENNIVFSGEILNEYKVTLAGVNMGIDSGKVAVPGASGSLTEGMILVSKDNEGYLEKAVNLKLEGENIVRGIRYCADESTDGYLNINSKTSGSTEGSLYIPKKVEGEEAINAFINSSGDYNYGNSGIGAATNKSLYGLNIKGGTIQVLTTEGDNCAAIGGGTGIGSDGGSCGIEISGGFVKTNSIRGGCSENGNGGNAAITVSGGEINVIQKVGGGNAGTDGKGGDACLTVSGGTIDCPSVTGGNSASGTPGSIKGKSPDRSGINISGGKLITGYIEGGKNNNNELGAVTANIEDGTVQSQFILDKNGVSESCSFVMSGGILDNTNLDVEKYQKASVNGGAIYMNDADGVINISGGTIQNCKAQNGGGIYVANGKLTLTGGNIHNNKAAENGGGLYIAGGKAVVKGGNIDLNKAEENGGGIAAGGGMILMISGNVDNNASINGKGGGIYINSENASDEIHVIGGSISGNQAICGGGIAAEGSATVKIGVNHNHDSEFTYNSAGFTSEDFEPELKHSKETCPKITDNSSGEAGGGIYLNGNESANFCLCCIEESGNKADNESGNSESESDFMMAENGNILITTGTEGNAGNVDIKGSVCLNGGNCTIEGTMENPIFEDCITVNVDQNGGSFNDMRTDGEEKYYTLKYYENQENSTKYKVYQVLSGEQKAVSGTLYPVEENEVLKWNTDAEGNGKTYEPGVLLTFNGLKGPLMTGNIALFATPEPKKYAVHFNVNAPDGIPYSGTMEDQQFTCGEAQDLSENKFVLEGYDFKGWSTSADGAKQYDDKASVSNLTDEDGELVELYAVWEQEAACTHDDPDNVYYVIKGGYLIQECNCGNYRSMAGLSSISDKVYDGETLTASLNYSNGEEGWIGAEKPVIVYQKKGDDGNYSNLDSSVNEGKPVNAGEYKAIIDVSGYKDDKGNALSGEVSKTFTIEKANQDAPGTEPTYKTEGKDKDAVLTIISVGNKNTEGKEGYGNIQYVIKITKGKDGNEIKYYDKDGKEQNTPSWIDESAGGGLSMKADIKGDTKVYIYARFSGDENHYPSPATPEFEYDTGEQVAGTILEVDKNNKINIVTNKVEGITSLTYKKEDVQLTTTDPGQQGPAKAGGGAAKKTKVFLINFVLDDAKYYMTTKTPVIVDTDKGTELDIKSLNSNYYSWYSPIDTDIKNKGYTKFVINVTGAKKKPVPEVSVKSGYCFEDFENESSAKISPDSAFAAQFDYDGMYTGDYKDPVLTFTNGIPAKTSIIMQAAGELWYYKAGSALSTGATLDLSQFSKMGATGQYSFENNPETTFRFNVDFTQVEESNQISGDFEMKLNLSKRTETTDDDRDDALDKIPDITEATANIEVGTKSSVSMTAEKGSQDNEQNINITYNEAGGKSVKHDNRSMSLVLTAKSSDSVISDTHLIASYDNKSVNLSLNKNRQFVIPLESFRDLSDINLKLVSESFAMADESYSFEAAVYSGYKGLSATNGTKEAYQDISFEKSQYKPASIKVTGTAADRVCEEDGTLKVNIATENIESGLNTTYSIQKKGETDLEETGLTGSVSKGSNEISLTSLEEGCYCLMVYAKKGNANMVKVPYYFVIDESDESETD